jgi:predicted nucleotidyltransferase
VEAVEAALAAVRARFGPDLVAVVLAGSHAAGTARPGSDVNLIVIARGLPPPGPERRQAARELSRAFLWAGHGRLSVELVLPEEVGPAEPGEYRVLAGAGTEAVGRLLPAEQFAREDARWTSRLPF